MFGISVPSPYDRLNKSRDRSERAVGLENGEIDLVRSLILSGAKSEGYSAKIEWGASDRVEKRFTRRLTRNSLQGFDHELADQIAFNRYKARFCARTSRRKCRLIRRHNRQRL